MDLPEAYWFQEGPGVRRWQFTKSGIKLLNVANITKEGEIDLTKTDRHLSEEEVEHRYSHFLIDEGDLVIASSGISFDEDGLLRTRGNFIRAEHLPLCMNTSTIRFKSKQGISDLRFLRYWLDSFEFREQITRRVTGSAQQNFGPSHLKQTKITLPPLAEQQRIADILARADRLRQLRRYALQLSDTYLQAVFLRMFGDPVTNPMGWPQASLRELVEINPRPRHKLDDMEQTVSFLPMAAISELGHVEWEEIKYISEVVKGYTYFERGDVLLAKITPCFENGKAALTDGISHPVGFASTEFHVLRPNKDIYGSFLFHVVWNTRFRSIGEQSMRGSAGQKRIPTDFVGDYLTIVPSTDAQSRFARFTELFSRVETQQHEAVRQADHLFDTLLHRAFRQEL